MEHTLAGFIFRPPLASCYHKAQRKEVAWVVMSAPRGQSEAEAMFNPHGRQKVGRCQWSGPPSNDGKHVRAGLGRQRTGRDCFSAWCVASACWTQRLPRLASPSRRAGPGAGFFPHPLPRWGPAFLYALTHFAWASSWLPSRMAPLSPLIILRHP